MWKTEMRVVHDLGEVPLPLDWLRAQLSVLVRLNPIFEELHEPMLEAIENAASGPTIKYDELRCVYNACDDEVLARTMERALFATVRSQLRLFKPRYLSNVTRVLMDLDPASEPSFTPLPRPTATTQYWTDACHRKEPFNLPIPVGWLDVQLTDVARRAPHLRAMIVHFLDFVKSLKGGVLTLTQRGAYFTSHPAHCKIGGIVCELFLQQLWAAGYNP